MATTLDIRPLTPERLPDLASLFEQGGDPKWCWCAYFRIRGFDFSKGGKERHRAAMEAATHETAREGRAPGLVAFDGDEAVGWISIGPREDYERLAHSSVLKPLDDKPVWSIVCFVVGRRSRGAGVAKALLDAGIVRPGDVYRGTLSMFERAGFTVAERRPTPGGAPRPIVRRAIRPRRRPHAS
jgi:hypothetical protein